MNILFITLLDIASIDEHNIYADLMRKLAMDNHNVYIVSPTERRNKKSTKLIENIDAIDWHKNVHILRKRIGNIQKTNFIEKGISTVLLEGQLTRAIKKYFHKVHFNLVIYSTPPITLLKPIKYVKRKNNCRSYLILKDIFPQNAVDLGILTKTGLKGFLYGRFRKKEIELYKISDKIGCMSQANVNYILKHNLFLKRECVEIFPNCIDIVDESLDENEADELRKKYDIPLDKCVFVYGGNLGKPQCADFIIECIKSQKDNPNNFFLIVGDGTDFYKLDNFQKETKQSNFKIMKRLPKDDYDKMIAACDVGLLFLDYRFTIPNFPSRLLAYMQAKLPVLACTDLVSDIKATLADGKFGWWCPSNDVDSFKKVIDSISKDKLSEMKTNSFNYLLTHFSVESNIHKLTDEGE